MLGKATRSKILWLLIGSLIQWPASPILNYYFGSVLQAKLDEWTYKCNEGIEYCVSIDQSNRWEGYENFTKEITQSEKIILRPIITKNFPEGQMMYTKQDFSPNFNASISILPLGDNASNVVVEFENQIRCILGDGDYRAIVCQKNTGYPIKTNEWVNLIEINSNKERVYIPNGGIRSQTRFDVQFELISQSNSNLASTLRLEFVPVDNQINQESITLNYGLDIPYLMGDRGKIGIGLLDPKRTDNISAIFGDLLVDILPATADRK